MTPVERGRGFGAVEMLIALAVFAVLLLVAAELERELALYQRNNIVELFSHPELDAVIVRLRADVLDSAGYPASFDGWVQTPATLLLTMPSGSGATTVVWDFTERGVVRRIEYRGATPDSEWIARGMPELAIASETMPDGDVAVRAIASADRNERIVDRVFAPRTH